MSDTTRLDTPTDPAPMSPRDAELTAPAAVTTTLDTQAEREEAAAARRGIRQLLPRRSAKLIIGLVIVVAIVAFGILGPLFVQDPRYSGNDALQPPSPEHLLGTTKLGYDVLAQLAYGTQGSLMVGIIAALIALTLSVVFGILAGYIGGWGDEGL